MPYKREVLSELPLSWGLSQPCKLWSVGCTYITGNIPRHRNSIPYTTRMVPGVLLACGHQPQDWFKRSVSWRSLSRRAECCSWGWPYTEKNTSCSSPLPATAETSSMTWRPAQTFLSLVASMLTSAFSCLLLLLLLLLWRSTGDVTTHVWKQNSIYVTSAAYWHGTAQ